MTWLHHSALASHLVCFWNQQIQFLLGQVQWFCIKIQTKPEISFYWVKMLHDELLYEQALFPLPPLSM